MASTAALSWWLASAIALQPPGDFHGDEVTARSGERWLAVHVADSGATMATTTLRVSAVEDAVLDEPGQRTGRRVESAGMDDIRLYLRGPGLRPGRIETAVVSPGPAGSVFAHAIQWRGRAFFLQSQCETAPPVADESKIACRIELTDGKRHQTLAVMGGSRGGNGEWVLGDDASPQLILAGDLDRDGRLDLILDTSDHYNLRRPTLFLSSRATDGAIVGSAAEHESVGC